MYNIKNKIEGVGDIDIPSDNKLNFRDADLYVTSTTDGQLDLVADTKIKINAPDTQIVGLKDVITMGCGRVVAVSTFTYNNVTQTEAAAAFCKVQDGTAYLNLAVSGGGGGYAANYQLFPGTEVIGDAAYFGKATPFGAIYMDMSATVGIYNGDAITWEYYNGTTWDTLTLLWDVTDTTANDGKRPFQGDGYILFSAPTDWASTTVDTQAAYWIRARVSAAEITTAPLTNDVEHKTFAFDAGTKVPYAGTASRARFEFETASATNNDTKLILVNGTSGAASAIKTLAGGKIDIAVTDFALTVAKDDVIGFFITAEDGTTEYAGGTCELTVTRT